MSYAAMRDRSDKVQTTRVVHGGGVYEAARRWGIDPDEVIDFSANINPLGPPSGVIAAAEASLRPSILRAYPDVQAFVGALADKERLMPDEIVIGSGVAALMFAIMRAILPRRVLLLEPAFGEYSRACNAVKAEVITWQLTPQNDFTPSFAALISAVEKHQFDLFILNSPHNPTGALYPIHALQPLIRTAEENNTAVMLDEAFIDYVPQSSLVSLAAKNSKLVVLRSLTKFYAIPGIRVGYAVSSAGLAGKIREQIDPWPVSTVALDAALAALDEDEFGSETRRLSALAREEFSGALCANGLQVFPSAANFLLVKLPRGSGASLESFLAAERILIRRCDSFRGLGDSYIRVAVRHSPENLRLVYLLKKWFRRNVEIGK